MFLQIQDLVKEYTVSKGWFGRQREVVRALNQVSFTIDAGETLGLVGKAGCGKSTLANILLRFIPATAGSIYYDGKDLLPLSQAEFRTLRPELQMIFSNPYASMNPRMTVFEIVAEPLIAHRGLKRTAVREQVADLLLQAGLKTDCLPHSSYQLSSGQAQRVSIARAIAMNPRLLVLDEPTSTMNDSEAHVFINLLIILQRRFDLTYLISSDRFESMRLLSDRIAVMAKGEIVEIGRREEIMTNPQHPHTRTLLSAIQTP
ncbi:MAG: ATP-binding cassette domain-containing protein [Chloroflexota bacterium]